MSSPGGNHADNILMPWPVFQMNINVATYQISRACSIAAAFLCVQISVRLRPCSSSEQDHANPFLNVLVRSTYCGHRVQITSWGIFLKTLTRLKLSVSFYEYCSSFKSLLSASVQERRRSLRAKDLPTFARFNRLRTNPRHPADFQKHSHGCITRSLFSVKLYR